MGTVYAAEHVEIGKSVAVKVLHPQYSRQQDLVERFRREARAASRIGHPNIVDVTDFGTTDDGVRLLRHGAPRRHRSRRRALARAARSRRCARRRSPSQICRALEAAHAAGVIHRDLKPENIFLVARDGKRRLRQGARLRHRQAASGQDSSRLTNPGIAMGTPEYMAPEQALGGLADRARATSTRWARCSTRWSTGEPPHARPRRRRRSRSRSRRGRRASCGPSSPRSSSVVILRALERRSGEAAAAHGGARVRPLEGAVGQGARGLGPARPARARTRAPRTAAVRAIACRRSRPRRHRGPRRPRRRARAPSRRWRGARGAPQRSVPAAPAAAASGRSGGSVWAAVTILLLGTIGVGRRRVPRSSR